MRISAPFALLPLALACAQRAEPPPSNLQAKLERAADLEGVPRSLLVALAWVDSRMQMDAVSRDGAYGLLHLVDRDDAPAALSLPRASRLTGLLPSALRGDAFANARGGAALLRAEADELFAKHADLDPRRLGDWWEPVMRLSGVTDARTADSFASQVFRLLRDGLAVEVNGELVRLAAQDYDASPRAIWGSIDQDLSGEYCPNGACVAFVPASTSNYNAGRDETVSMVVIHDMEGTYSGSIAWFQNPVAQACAHYLVRSSDGEITQMVHDADTAWHAGNHVVNNSSIGIEHEGYAHTGTTWFTEAMYRSSAALTRWLCDTFHIPVDRTHIIGHYEVPDPDHGGWYGGASNHHDPCDSWAGDPTWHNNIACYWNWGHYMDLVSGGAGTGTLTGFVGDACCGIAAGTRRPLVGATVVLAGTAYSAKTDSGGTYAFTLPAGSYAPQASFSGYVTADHTSLGSGYPATLSVAAGSTVWGSIVLQQQPAVVQPPVVKITLPADDAVLASSPATVKGTVSDGAIAAVQVDGAATPVASGAFTATVALTNGANAIVVTATNSAGTGSATVHVSYAPPQTGVQGHVTGPAGPVADAGVTLSPGGAHTTTASDGSYAIEAAPGAYTASVDAAGFAGASQQVTVPAGKVVTADFALAAPSAPPAPHIRVDTPDDGATLDTDSVLVAGVAEMPDLQSLTIDDEQVEFDAAGAFSVQVPLQQGSNGLVILATDSHGTSLSVTLHVTYEPVALSRTGCATAGQPGAVAALALLLLRRRRERGAV
ncbi:MAG TPA: N-acetylmuramoyl-L-alanine amidase [Myxococcales bacterium]|nr:N-acetylmuramoyl-L-alanine amidase [Myxococcales bacterium]